MPAKQLHLLDLDGNVDVEVDVEAGQPTRPSTRRTCADVPPATVSSTTLVAGEVLIEHRYPVALDFLREHGPDVVAVLHVLLADAQVTDGRLMVAASTRGVAERLGFLSKDSAHRRLRQLRRAGVLEALPSTGPMDPLTYVVHLDSTGITVARPSR